MKKVAVIGGGAAGCMAACAAAGNGAQVTVFERQDKCARKIYATGNGRCNLTNLCRKKKRIIRRRTRNAQSDFTRCGTAGHLMPSCHF